MGEVAVLVGGPQDGAEVTLRDWAVMGAPTVFVAAPAAISLVGPEERYPMEVPLRGVYVAPRFDGGWSRDDAGRLRLTWRGWDGG